MASKKETRSSGDGYLARPSTKRPKPEFSITEKDLPAIKDWSVGKKYAIELNVEMVSQSKGSDWEIGGDKDIHSARFKIISIDNSEGAEKSENTAS